MSDFTKTVVVDGNTSTAIRDGIAALPTGQNGGTVIVEAGTYTITSTISIPSNVTLIGRGNVILKTGSSFNFPVFQNASTGTGNSRIVISGFKIIIAFTLDSGHPNGYDNHPIWLENTHDCIVEKVYVTAKDVDGTSYRIDNNYNAILIRATAENLCYNNTVRQCVIVDYGKTENSSYYYGTGIGVFSTPEASRYCKQISVINNYTSNTLAGCFIDGATECMVIGNIFTNTHPKLTGSIQGADGILTRYCDNSQFVGNQLISTKEHGVYLSLSSKCSESGNISISNGQNGLKINSGAINCEYNTLCGNVSVSNGTDLYGDGMGIDITGQDTGMTQYTTAFGNVCTNNWKEGIAETDVTHVNSNTIVGNMCGLNRAASYLDLYIRGVSSQKSYNLGRQ